MEKILEDLKINKDSLIKIILSDSVNEVKKIIVRPILLKANQKWQIERFIGAQAFHENVDFERLLSLEFGNFKQITL